MGRSSTVFRWILLTLCAGAISPWAHANDKGAAIYEKQCVECHGANGDGVPEEYDEPLYGNRSLESLAKRIERTMPEGNEDACVGEDAYAVAEYIYHAFYSPKARARQTEVKTDLLRLTGPQYRTSVADLVGSFQGGYPRKIGPERGLKGRYFGTRQFRGEKEKQGKDRFERIDPRVRFDFGLKTPDDANMTPQEFSIRWEGVLLIEETGTYEFVIRTRNGAQLWINERDTKNPPVIDAWVAKGNEVRDERGSMFLLGGRTYRLQLDYFKYKEEKASIELLWKSPHGVLETIPRRVLSPDFEHETLIVTTPFPPDDRSYGYERGIGISRAWLDAVTQASLEAAEGILENVNRLPGVKEGAPDRGAKLRQFCHQFAERAFRRPLTGEEKQRYVDSFFKESDDIDQAVKRSVMMSLTAPAFLYPELPGGKTPSQRNATRLALALWDSVPDPQLERLAKEGRLELPQHVRAQARRMLEDSRAKAKLRGFFHHWLELDRADNVSKDGERFPEFTPEVMADLRTSLNLFLDSVVWGDNPDFRRLLTEDQVFINNRLAPLYGHGKLEPGFHPVKIDGGKRSGVVTHPYLLTSFAYHNATSPIHRGVFLTRNIVGMTLKPPPEAIEFTDSNFDPKLTMREKVTELTRAKACMACHSTINPLGFSLENFDAIGRWRAKETNNKPINPQSDFTTETGETIRLKSARDVAEYAANSPAAQQAFVRQLFHHMVKQPVPAYGLETIDRLRDDFEASGFDIRHLMVEIAVMSAMHEHDFNRLAEN